MPGWPGGTDGDPVQAPVLDVVADLEAEDVAVEGQRRLRVVVREEAVVDAEVHGDHARGSAAAGASRFLTGLVTFFATHGAIPSAVRGASRR